jgi:hypothetical protein
MSDAQTIASGLADGSWLQPLLLAIVSILGAYFGGRVAKDAEYAVTKERFEEIREQMRTTAQDTEEIKQRLAGSAWRSQQEWSARERYYSQLLTHLHQFKMALEELSSDYFLEPGTEHMPDEERDERFHKLRRDAGVAFAEAEKLLGPAALFLQADTVKGLNALFARHWGLANFEAICTADYVRGACKLASQGYAQVLSDAQRQLGIEAR